MSSPLVSIIIPFYNTGNRAQKLIKDVLDQSYKNLQIIFVNDGSTDNTLNLLEKSAEQDKRITLINQKNSGSAAGARNSGLQKATGEFIMFADSDDEISQQFVKKMLNKIQTTNSDLVTCGFKYHRLSTSTTTEAFTNPVAKQRPSESLSAYVIRLLGNNGHLYSVVNKIFRTDLIKQHQLKFDSKLNFGEDLLFVLTYLKHAKQISFLYEPLYTYHYGTQTSTVKNSSLKYENWQQNWQFLTKWFRPHSPAETDCLNWIKYRWSYSYCLAVYRSSKPRSQKYELLRAAVKDSNLPPVGSPKNIGTGKYLQEKFYRVARKNPSTLYKFIAAVAKIKQAGSS
ncbi:glycosyltransferase [Candidatus Saccharibacteria bacterium]|nr:glycosyltransferase [Candidatus Saccharibacteria bacterium]